MGASTDLLKVLMQRKHVHRVVMSCACASNFLAAKTVATNHISITRKNRQGGFWGSKGIQIPNINPPNLYILDLRLEAVVEEIPAYILS